MAKSGFINLKSMCITGKISKPMIIKCVNLGISESCQLGRGSLFSRCPLPLMPMSITPSSIIHERNLIYPPKSNKSSDISNHPQTTQHFKFLNYFNRDIFQNLLQYFIIKKCFNKDYTFKIHVHIWKNRRINYDSYPLAPY